MPDMNWRDAITQVLRNSPEAMHYVDIAEAISERGLRTQVGATPQQTVNGVISSSLNEEGNNSPFVRVDRGRYWLRELSQKLPQVPAEQVPAAEPDGAGLINAFGMYWARGNVLWSPNPQILGQQQPGSTPVNFSEQRGVYLLYDGRSVIYVGRTTDQPLGARLRQHVGDRLNGRWDRFSWFGVYRAAENGELEKDLAVPNDVSVLIATMEALLIEGLEPPQNRKRGDDFRAVEFLQVEDPEIAKNRILNLMEELKKKL